MIKMISGVTRIGDYTHTPSSGAFSANPNVEARLVNMKAAIYVQSQGQDVATVADGSNDTSATENMGSIENGIELSEESLGAMTVKELREFAFNLGINVSNIRLKSEIISTILSEGIAVEGEEVESPPNLGVEGLVV
jgi:hypothetical protein